MKTRCFQRTLAILLSVLLATPLFVLPAFAESEEGFNRLATDTADCESGDTWYNRAALAAATGVDAYEKASFYLSEDGNTLRITYRDAEDNSVTEEYARDTDPQYFEYICVLPAFGDPLPTSDEGLEDGDYWYDLAGLLALLEANGVDQQTVNAISGASFRLSADGEILRMTVTVDGSSVVVHQDEFTAEPDVFSGFLYQVGVDPNAGFTLLPTSDEGLEDGDYWIDAAGFSVAVEYEELQQAQYYLSDDGSTIRLISPSLGRMDILRDSDMGTLLFPYLRQVGVDPNAGFTLLPTSDEGLEDGDYWFDAAGLAAASDDEALQQAQYYLSDDGNTIRLISSSIGTFDVAKDSDTGALAFAYLRQVGVDPDAIEGFVHLPFSDEGLEDGDYWYDAAALAEMFGSEYYLNYKYYLSDDGTTLRIKMGDGTLDVTEEDDMSFYFLFLRQVGIDPYPGFILLPKSDAGLAAGDYWYDAAGFAAMGGGDSALRALYLLSEDGSTLRITESGYTFEIHKDAGGSGPYFAYLRTAGEVYTVLPTSDDGLEDGDWWYDAAGLAEGMQDDSFLTATYSLSENGETLCIVNGETTMYYQNDAGYAQYFLYLYQVGAADYELLPTSAAGLAFGAYWYDAAGLAALENDESLLDAVYYRNAETGALRIVIEGYPVQISPGDDGSEEVFSFLHQVTVDPETGVTFTFLPLSDEGLQDGDYWYDAASFAAGVGSDDYLTYLYYLSEDGTTLRVVIGDACVDLPKDDENGYTAFYFVRQVGVDPNAGFILLPTSSDGLQNGEWWFDAAGFAAAEGDDSFLTTSYYLSEDGSELRFFFGGLPTRVLVDDPDMADVTAFLHQVGDDAAGQAILTLSAPADPVYLGQTFSVTVDLTQNPGLAGMTLSLSYDDAVLTLTDVQASGMFGMGNLTLGGDMNLLPYNILWDDATAHDNHSETGTILTLTFTVKNTAAAGETTVTLTYDEESTFDVDLQNVPLVVSGAALTVIARMPGDVDGDGELDLADVAALTRFLAGGWDVTIDEDNADVNGDGSIDLKDVILIRRFLAGGWGVVLV